ncbi:hypothetical protein GCM10016455_05990 [Aliiroseovarius zhejiangensis]|uniref:Uncharacterized protein n=1 Tax=Aliiroseovarius zhejiangensis TaxID=1632025 RepID=A0ABQ3IMI6_9RHOB|nr:hypothetical protein [Aliiroseovarius zhejiangensis]GHE88651.1 hypothetical protein GCM10016455_05990 [Aliiroseovarius zhejiangensis]
MDFLIEHKTGDTFDYAFDAFTDDDQPFDLTGWTATSQARDSRGAALVQDLTVTTYPSLFRVQAPAAEVAGWPHGQILTWDLFVVSPDGRKRHTDTIHVKVTRGITRDET